MSTPRRAKRARDCDLQSHSERPDLTARDLHLLPVELSHDEAVEALVVGAAMVAQEPERLLLADEEAAHAVGAQCTPAASRPSAMLAASLSISLPRETSAAPGLQRRAVRRGLDRMRQWLRRWSL